MRTTLAVSALALIVAATPAIAADAYSRGGYKDAPATIADTPAYSWTGFYGYAGGAIDNVNHDLTATGFELNGLSGFGYGGEFGAGYDMQFNRFVAGVWAYYGLSNASTTATFPGGSGSYDLNYRWGAGARAGVLPTQSTLIYASLGYGAANFTAGGDLTKISPSLDHTFNGLLVGGGIETQLGGGFFGGIDYKALLGDADTLYSPANSNFALKDTPTVQTVTFKVGYKLGSGYTSLK